MSFASCAVGSVMICLLLDVSAIRPDCASEKLLAGAYHCQRVVVQCAMLPLAAAAATQALHVARLHSYARPRQRRHHCARRRSDRIPAQPCKDALARILEEFIAKELRPYIRTFDTEFYEHLFRLRGLEFPKDS